MFTTLTAKKAQLVLNEPKASLARKKSIPSKTHLPAQAAQPTIKGNSCGTPGREITTLAHLSPRVADVTSQTGLATLRLPSGHEVSPGTLPGLWQCLPRAQPVWGGTSPGTAVPAAPSPAEPLPAALTAEAQLAELAQSHRGFAEHLLEVRDPEGTEAGVITVGTGNPRPPKPSEPPVLESPRPAQRSPDRVGREQTPVPTQTPTPTCSGAGATWRPRRPFPARRINAPAGNAARGGGCGMGPAPEGVVRPPSPHGPALR